MSWTSLSRALRRGGSIERLSGQPTEACALVGASNPKALLFFAAFFPQFIDPASPMLPQFALLAATFLAGDALVMSAWAFGVGRLLPVVRRGNIGRWLNRVCGGLFALLGALLLLTRRQA